MAAHFLTSQCYSSLLCLVCISFKLDYIHFWAEGSAHVPWSMYGDQSQLIQVSSGLCRKPGVYVDARVSGMVSSSFPQGAPACISSVTELNIISLHRSNFCFLVWYSPWGIWVNNQTGQLKRMLNLFMLFIYNLFAALGIKLRVMSMLEKHSTLGLKL